MLSTNPPRDLLGARALREAPQPGPLARSTEPEVGRLRLPCVDRPSAALLAAFSPRFRDLILVVYRVMETRLRCGPGAMGGEEPPVLHHVLPVEEPAFWSREAVLAPLRLALGPLCGEADRLDFVATPPQPRAREAAPDPREVVVFGRGPEAVVGALEALRAGRRLLLVGCIADPQDQRRWEASRAVLPRESGAVQELRVVHGAEGAPPAGRGHDLVLHLAVAAAAAAQHGERALTLCEGGVAALNLPHTRGGLARVAHTTAHPKTLAAWEALLGAIVDEPFRIRTPFQLLTLAEVMARPGARAAGESRCIRPVGEALRRCGACPRCLDHRLARLHHEAETPEEARSYAYDVFRVSLGDPALRGVEVYTRAAETWAAADDAEDWAVGAPGSQRAIPALLRRSGMEYPALCEQVYAMHRRQGRLVQEVLARLARDAGGDVLRGRVHPESLLGRAFLRGLRSAGCPGGTPPEEPPAAPPAGPLPPEESTLPPRFCVIRGAQGTRPLTREEYQEVLADRGSYDLFIDGVDRRDAGRCRAGRRAADGGFEEVVLSSREAAALIELARCGRELPLVRIRALADVSPASKAKVIELARRRIDRAEARYAWRSFHTTSPRGCPPTYQFAPPPELRVAILWQEESPSEGRP